MNGSLISSSSFTDNHIAMVMHGSNALLGKVIVRNSDFSNSSTAILSLSADYCEIYSNNINVNQNANSDYAGGIYLELTPNFYVEGNTVTGVSYSSSFPDNTYGIIVNSSGENNNSIYRNTVSHCEYNISGIYNNRGTDQGTGLLFTCNDLSETSNNNSSSYTQHTYYMYSDAYNGYETDPLHSVNMMQGGGAYDLSSNMFIPTTSAHNVIPKRLYLSSGDEHDFYTNHLNSNAPSDILYKNPYQGSSSTDEYLNYYTLAGMTGSYYHGITPMYETQIYGLQTCPTQIPPPQLPDINASLSEKANFQQSVSTAKQAFANYENNGDYNFMYNIATNITSANYVTAYYYLMNNHPGYDILGYAVGDDDLPTYMVRDILVTNSYGIKSQLVRDALNQRQTPLTSTQLNDINTVAQSISQFEEYQMEISMMLANLQNTKMAINRYYHQADTNEVDIKGIIDDLNNTGDFYSHYALMMYYFKIGDLNLAQNHFNSAISDDIINDNEKIQLDVLFNILYHVYNDFGGDFSQLSQNEIDELINVSYTYTKSGGTAKVILLDNFVFDYEPEYIEPDNNSERQAKGVTNIIDNNANSDISIAPNPASTQFGLILNDNVKYPLQLEVFDVSGKLVLSKKVEYLSTISTEGIKTGIYSLRITDVNNKTYIKKLIIK